MKITLHGAAGGEVTGSAYLVETDQSRVLVDFGMFQGVPHAEVRNRIPAGVDVSGLDAVLLTHAHLDHTGRLPLLARQGYAKPVFATPATIDITNLILHDSAKVQAQDLARVNRKRERAGEDPVAALYGTADVERLVELCRPVPYDQPVPVAPGLQARFVEAGHLLGSASIQLVAEEAAGRKTVVFSGDLGPKGVPILRDAGCLEVPADAVFLESTYGDHDHQPFAQTVGEFREVLQAAVADRGRILVPTFAVGRAQLMLVLLACFFRRGELPKFPVFLDSPMAAEASRIYLHHPELFDEELLALREERPLLADLSTLRVTATAEESKSLNEAPGPWLVLAGAGMCNAGRILHHLRQHLWRPDTHVLIVGYQAEGTLGRLLVEKAKSVSIFGEKVAVRARVHTLGGFSAHAGQRDLLEWFACLARWRPRVFLTHGEKAARATLAGLIRERHGLEASLPAAGETVVV
jgi:metallo-beta-lactamase family protein